MNRHRPLLQLASLTCVGTRAATLAAALAVTVGATLAACVPSAKTAGSAARTEPTGHFEEAQPVEIRSQVAGFIDRVQFVEGARVRKGEVLFRIDPRPFRAEAERQRAARTRALIELDLAKANRARAQRLMGENALSQEQMEQLSNADRVAANDLAAANAALSAAKLDLESTEVRAPIDGRVSRALVTQGKLATSDSLLTTLVADDRGI